MEKNLDSREQIKQAALWCVSDEGLEEARSDIVFVKEAIESAELEGREIDSELIDEIAAARHEVAMGRPSAVDAPGLTPESSRAVVEKLVVVHQTFAEFQSTQ